MTVIKSLEYEQTRQRLMADPIVIAMARSLRGYALFELAHDSGTPRFEFAMAANREYERRGGDMTTPRHIGAVPEALLRLISL